MLINAEIAATNPKDLLIQLQNLPSHFSNLASNKIVPILNSDEQKIYDQALMLYNTLDRQLTSVGKQNIPQKIDSGILPFLMLNPAVQSNLHFYQYAEHLLGEIFAHNGNFEHAITSIKNAANIAVEREDYGIAENLYKRLAKLHINNNSFDSYKKGLENNLINIDTKNQNLQIRIRLALGAVYRMTGEHDKALDMYDTTYPLQQGRIDYEAHRVEQHEVGFSNKEKIGTDNIQQCVTVIIYDPETKKTALAHVDKFTDAKSLSMDVLPKFDISDKNKKLQVFLVGGRDRTIQGVNISDTNIEKVVLELSKHNFLDIKVADVGNKTQIPSGIVFDPMTGKLENAVPAYPDQTTAIRQARICLPLNSGLNFAFDLTASKSVPEFILTDDQKEIILWKYLDSSIEPPNGVPETWQSNIITTPLNRAAKKIYIDNPILVKEFLSKYLNKMTSSHDLKAIINQNINNVINSQNHTFTDIKQAIFKTYNFYKNRPWKIATALNNNSISKKTENSNIEQTDISSNTKSAKESSHVENTKRVAMNPFRAKPNNSSEATNNAIMTTEEKNLVENTKRVAMNPFRAKPNNSSEATNNAIMTTEEKNLVENTKRVAMNPFRAKPNNSSEATNNAIMTTEEKNLVENTKRVAMNPFRAKPNNSSEATNNAIMTTEVKIEPKLMIYNPEEKKPIPMSKLFSDLLKKRNAKESGEHTR